MQLTRQTDFAFRTLIYLAAQPPEALVKIQQICAVFELSPNHLSKIVNKLARLGYIDSQRGRGGGLRLGAAPKDINVGAVARDMEPTLDPVDCSGLKCALLPRCRLKGVFAEASAAFIGVMDTYTLADLIEGELKVVRGLG
ncbi:MAG: Rrf2 family transcriptional regulator [Halioglobus sp.]